VHVLYWVLVVAAVLVLVNVVLVVYMLVVTRGEE